MENFKQEYPDWLEYLRAVTFARFHFCVCDVHVNQRLPITHQGNLQLVQQLYLSSKEFIFVDFEHIPHITHLPALLSSKHRNQTETNLEVHVDVFFCFIGVQEANKKVRSWRGVRRQKLEEMTYGMKALLSARILTGFTSFMPVLLGEAPVPAPPRRQ